LERYSELRQFLGGLVHSVKQSCLWRALVLLRDFASLVQATATVLLKAGVLVLIVGFGGMFIWEVTKRTTTIEPIVVPPGLAERGYTSEITARLLRDGINGVIGKASAPAPDFSIRGDLPDIVVPTVGLSFETLVAFFRTVLYSSRHTIISGEIIRSDNILSLQLRINGQPVYFQRPFALDLPQAWEEAAAVVLRQEGKGAWEIHGTLTGAPQNHDAIRFEPSAGTTNVHRET
jgi:hypothetical protein